MRHSITRRRRLLALAPLASGFPMAGCGARERAEDGEAAEDRAVRARARHHQFPRPPVWSGRRGIAGAGRTRGAGVHGSMADPA
jgi:hypothetical protein